MHRCMELGQRIGVKMLHRSRRGHMSAQKVCFQSMNIEVSVEKLEFPADVADDRIKVSGADRHFAALQESVQTQCAYRWHVVLLLIAYRARQRDFPTGNGSIPKSGPGVLRMKRNFVRSADGRLRVVPYLTFQFDRGGSHGKKQRPQREFGGSCLEAGSQVVGKRFHISVQNAPVSIRKIAIVTFSSELSLDFDL